MASVTLLEIIFEAVASGDIELFQKCSGQMTIETVLQFERLYETSALHLCVKIGGMKYRPMVQCLLRTGLFDDACVDEDRRTILTYANAIGNPELLTTLIEVITEEMDDATACYRMLRHNLREVFQTFLNINKLPEEKEFQCIAGALLQLNLKNIKLSKDLHIFTLWKLSDYGFRKLSGDWPGTKDPNEWKYHFNVIRMCSEDILNHHDTGMYDDVDDLFLYRLHTLHNHLYFIKHKPFLKYLPLHEAVFCVAVFLSVYRDDANFRQYRLTINKCLVIDFVRMIHRQLTEVKKYLDQAEKVLLGLAKEVNNDDQEKDSLIQDLLAKIKASNLQNRDYMVNKYSEQAKAIGSSERDGLIKELLTKVKKIDKQAKEKKIKPHTESDKYEEYLICELRKRLPHVSHPQNVTKRLMSGLRKAKAVADIISDIISDEPFDLSHIMEEDSGTIRKMVDCYVISKQSYSLQKIIYYFEQMIIAPVANSDRLGSFIDQSYLKRTVQALGEAIKNTTNSPNLPGKALSIVYSMICSELLNINKLMREVFSHSVSLKQEMVGNTISFGRLHAYHIKIVLANFYLIFTLIVSDMKVMFLEFMGRCSSLDHIRSLALYVGDIAMLERRQNDYYRKVKKYYDDLSYMLSKRVPQPNGGSTQSSSWNFRKQVEYNRTIVHDLGYHLQESAGFCCKSLWIAFCYGDDLDAIRLLLNWKRTTASVNRFYHVVDTSWQRDYEELFDDEAIDIKLHMHIQTFYSNTLGKHHNDLKRAEAFDYIEHTRVLVKDLGVKKIHEKDLQQLNKSLTPYYNNMFSLSKKWDVLKKFFKEQKLTWDESTSRRLEDLDKRKLQKIYDTLRDQLRSILDMSGLQPDRPTKSLLRLPSHTLSAIEYIQLELCEMLQSAGYFGDSFHYVKHRIPMLQGKNYRNFLAHDALSYNLLTDSSSAEKIVVNAFVFATREVQLFDSNRNNKLHLTFPSLDEMEHCVTSQTQLLEAFQARNIQKLHDISKAGGEIKVARFCCSPNPTYVAAEYFNLAELINPCQADKSMVSYLNRYFTELKNRYNNPVYQLVMAKKLHDFQAVFDRTVAKGTMVTIQGLFDRPELMEQQPVTHFLNELRILCCIKCDLSTECFAEPDQEFNRVLRNIFKNFIRHGNRQCALERLPYINCSKHTEGRGPPANAMVCCDRCMTELLLNTTRISHIGAMQLSIVLHWDNIYTKLMDKTKLNAITFNLLLKTAIESGNYNAGKYLLETPTHSHLSVFEQCALIAANVGDAKFIQLILQARGPTMDATSLANTLYAAAYWGKHWKCVEILLRNRAPVDKPFEGVIYDEGCTLLILVKYGKYELLRHIDCASINTKELKKFEIYPFAVAASNGTATKQMIDALQQLGFDWLDSSWALHEAIRLQDVPTVETIFNRINMECVSQPPTYQEHFQLALGVLYRWKCISFLEESDSYECSLSYAALYDRTEMMENLLEQGRKIRTMPDVGALGGIVFQWNSFYICAHKRIQDRPELNIGGCCNEMISSIEFCSLALENWKWQQFTVDAQSIPITFHVFTAEEDILEPVDGSSLTLSNPDLLLDCLKELQSFVSSKLHQYDIIYACYFTAKGNKHFWQVEETACLYDVRSPPNGPIDLSESVNYRNKNGYTPLDLCSTIEIARLLMDNGANPLLQDFFGPTSMCKSLTSENSELAHYLLDECVARGLRSEQGFSVLEQLHGTETLTHVAVTNGRRDIIKRLIEHGANVSAVDNEGKTPAQRAASNRAYKADRIVKMLLEHDAKSINHVDGTGFTLVQYASFFKASDMLKVVLEYDPDLRLCRGTPSALEMTLIHGLIKNAICILDYAATHNVRGLTQLSKKDMVKWSLKWNNKELSTKLLEHELQHPLEEANEKDLPRLQEIRFSQISDGQPLMEFVLQRQLFESACFMIELLVLITKLRVKKNIPIVIRNILSIMHSIGRESESGE